MFIPGPTERNPHIQKHDEHCKQPGNGEEFRSQSPFYRHKKFRQRKPQSPKEGNPLLGHTLKDASLGQQNHSDNESLSYT
uniref:Ovule protein n=1 Tax=Loa loa TaxID=7209 RepID=A0A1I7W4B6_LOALO